MVFNLLQFSIILFLVVGFIFAGAAIVTSLLITPRAKGGDLGMPYECGMRPQGRSWSPFGFSYYVYALIFIAFDVDILYLFPVSVAYKDTLGMIPFYELSYFLFFVGLAVMYFNSKGVFTWPKKINL